MRREVKASFIRDLRRVREANIRRRVRRTIEALETASTIAEFTGATKIRAEGRFYRIRVGDYRIGVAVESDAVILVRFLHRRDIYRFFP